MSSPVDSDHGRAATARNPLTLGEKRKPTLKHRPAIWECMLGTVYAAAPSGEVRYFDYDYAGAIAFAEVEGAEDLRVFKHQRRESGLDKPRRGQFVLYARRES